MKQLILGISAISMFVALGTQLLNGSGYMKTVRMALGMQAFLSAIVLIHKVFRMLN